MTTKHTDSPTDRQPEHVAPAYPDPTQPGFYWRRTMHVGDRDEPGWRWTVVEVYRIYGQPDGPLMTNGYEVAGSGVEWGPQCESPTATPERGARGCVQYLGQGARARPARDHVYVTIEIPISDIGRVALYSDVEIVAAKKREATP